MSDMTIFHQERQFRGNIGAFPYAARAPSQTMCRHFDALVYDYLPVPNIELG
jgi:hypothetical protein